MAFPRSRFTIAACALLIAGCLASLNTAAQAADEIAEAARAELPELPVDGPWYANHELPIRSDGNLPGELRVFDESGNLVPARVRLFFLRDGEVITQTRPDDAGNFQVVGLAPGIYSVVAAGPEGFGAFSVRVLPASEPEAPPKTNTISDEKLREVSATRSRWADAPITMQVSLVGPQDAVQALTIGAQQMGLSLGGAAGGLGGLGGALSGAAGAGAVGGGSLSGLGALGATAGAVGALGSNQNNQGTVPGTTTGTTQDGNSPNNTGS